MSSVGSLSAWEALSGILGSISLASAILVLVPQLFENFKAKNAQGISLAFLAVWFVGDLTNFFGAIWAALVPTVIAIAFYFCLADAALILQCLYYRYYYTPTLASSSAVPQLDHLEDTRPLLMHEGSSAGLPGLRRRSSAPSERQQAFAGRIDRLWVTITKNLTSRFWLVNAVMIFGVCLLGAGSWVVAWEASLWLPVGEDASPGATRGPLGAEILGYISAVCYLSARIPQILKNYHEKSCEGLSLLFFMLSLLGNATYGGGIIFHSTQWNYILTNLPWLIGSLGTMGEDVLIFVQFQRYGKIGGY